MDNKLITVTGNKRSDYLRLIAAGHIEATALKILEWDWIDFFETLAKDPLFQKDIDLAREKRGDYRVDQIAETLDKKYFTEIVNPETRQVEHHERAPNKDENARDKLVFEKLKFLAQADNPKKYGNASGKMNIDVEVDLKNLKLLPPDEALRVLQNDPFAKKPTIIEATINEEKSDGKET